MTRAMIPTLLCLMLAAGAAAPVAPAAPAPVAAPAPPAPAPTLDEVVARASAVQEKKPQKLTCKVAIRASLLDSDGKPKEVQELERTESWEAGKSRRGPITKSATDGKPLTPKELQEVNAEDAKKQADFDARQQRGEGQELGPVFSKARAASLLFKLLREEPLGGRRALVLEFTPKPGIKDGRAGTAWVDAETFVALRVTSSPKPLPDHVDKMNMEEEQTLTAQGEVVPKRMFIDGEGGFFFLKRRFRLETDWSDCK
jgi:hypothetical protein